MTSINCDMGEAYGLYRMGDDEGLMPLISIANVACGFHASDFNHMRTTVRLAKRHGVPGPARIPPCRICRASAGARMAISREELTNCLIYQVGALKGFLEAEGVNPHPITSSRMARSIRWPPGSPKSPMPFATRLMSSKSRSSA